MAVKVIFRDMLRDFGFWATCTLLFINIAFFAWPDEPPYKDVKIIKSEIADGRFNLVADMTTTDCRFIQLEVIGIGLVGNTPPLEWKDDDGIGKHHIRLQGNHTLRISAAVNVRGLDRIEVRTRHHCNFNIAADGSLVGGEFVDLVFMSYDIEEGDE